MTLKRRCQAGFAAVALAGLIVACDSKNPTVPTPLGQPGVQPPPPAGPNAPLLNLLELSGPSTIAPGSTARFTVTASYGDGSFRDVTTEAAWRINGSSVLSISPGGIVTGLQRGQGSLEASFGGRTSTKSIMVLPDGTFRLSVSVFDFHVPVENARVTVLSPASNFEATATAFASFYGVAGEVEVRVNAPGYLEYKERLQVVAHQLLAVVLTLEHPREFVEGVYALTLSAAPECQSTLPAELMQRKYVADIAQIERGLIMSLMGPAFASMSNRRLNWFRGTLYLDRMTFSLSPAWSDDYYYSNYGLPEVLEEVTPTTFFSMFGSVVVTGPSSRKTGTLDGTIELIGPPPRFTRIAACKSNSHRFELVR